MFSNRLNGSPLLRGFALACLFTDCAALAWGPHSEITQAALDTLRTNDALLLQLGASARRLTNYCWMGDFHRLVMQDDEELFYADDYLLFPGATPQWEHFGPWLKTTFRPCFKRALQALRTETTPNAARWVGALVHFVEDAGAPPHALGIKGGLHSRMESWLDTKAIQVRGYEPRLLGETDEQALSALARRMEELDAFAKTRGQKLRLPVELGNHLATKPVVLECALETSRVVADVLYTLGQLASKPTTPGAALLGIVSGPVPAGVERFAPKIVLDGTNVSTLGTVSGSYALFNLRPGEYEATAFRPGCRAVTRTVRLVAGSTNRCDFTMPNTPTNFFRNGDFTLRWASPGTPDCWYRTKDAWESEFVPLQVGQRYRVSAQFKDGAQGTILVRWVQRYDRPLPAFQLIPKFQKAELTPANGVLLFEASKDKGVVQLIFKGDGSPDTALKSVGLEPVNE